MKKKAVVLVFPGSNCEKEAVDILNKFGFEAKPLWYEEALPSELSLCLIPGGFSYGDYLRSGAVAGKAAIMQQVAKFAANGGITIGICNGFQILTEAKILPGALMRSEVGHFVCKTIKVKRGNKTSIFTKDLKDELEVQMANADGRFVAEPEVIEMLKKEDRIAFTYLENNGSHSSIAGIIGGKNYNILGMMPHPERTLVSQDFLPMFESLKLNIV